MSEPRTLTLGPDCTIRTIRALRDDLTAALSDTPALTLDCAGVERADVTFIQLVLAAAKTAGRQGKSLALANLSPVSEAAFQRAGLPAHTLLAS